MQCYSDMTAAEHKICSYFTQYAVIIKLNKQSNKCSKVLHLTNLQRWALQRQMSMSVDNNRLSTTELIMSVDINGKQIAIISRGRRQHMYLAEEWLCTVTVLVKWNVRWYCCVNMKNYPVQILWERLLILHCGKTELSYISWSLCSMLLARNNSEDEVTVCCW